MKLTWWQILIWVIVGMLLGAAICYIALLIFLSKAFRW